MSSPSYPFEAAPSFSYDRHKRALTESPSGPVKPADQS